jgi:hypothetical protein
MGVATVQPRVARVDGALRQSRQRDEVERLRHGGGGPRALMAAVLKEAIVAARYRSRKAEQWIRDEDWEYPFSFNNICLVLNVDPDRLRDKIFRVRPQ